MYKRDDGVDQLLSKHKAEAEMICSNSSSMLLGKTFQATFDLIKGGGFEWNTSGAKLVFDKYSLDSTITRWVTELENYKMEQQTAFNKIEEPNSTEKSEMDMIKNDIDFNILRNYETLKVRIEDNINAFASTALAYRSPLHQAINDMQILYNELNHIEGDFSGYEDVSVYIHGIEDSGKGFLASAKDASEVGDVIVYEDRKGNKEYYVVREGLKGQKYIDEKPLTFEQLQNDKSYQNKEGRLHVVYETEYKNEHRQETSDDLAEKLIDMGVLNDETNIDLFAHSYGGRRAMQLAMDYPSYIRSITTIGTPYDKNMLSTAASAFPAAAEKMDKDPTEFSYYVDFDSYRTDDGIKHSNVYSDMTDVKMKESIEQLEAANPEAYKEFEEILMIAAAGRDTYTSSYHNEFTGKVEEVEIPKSNDGAVSVKSQHAESLGGLIDYRPSYDVKEGSIPHSAEIRNEDFINLIKQVNHEVKQ